LVYELKADRKLIKRQKYNKLNKSVWGMPRLSEAMKDVISCEKLRGLAHTGRSADIRMGQPSMLKTCYPIRRRTRGTETSKYPEEKKTKVIP
jgi:hypothetical protein